MTTEIPDLWDEDIKVDVLPPVVILRVQAEAISRKTHGILSATVRTEVEGSGEGGKRNLEETHILELTAPAYGYSEEILKVVHPESRVYPAKIELPERINWGNGTVTHANTAATVDEFYTLLREALRSPLTRSSIDTLLARSNETRQAAKV